MTSIRRPLQLKPRRPKPYILKRTLERGNIFLLLRNFSLYHRENKEVNVTPLWLITQDHALNRTQGLLFASNLANGTTQCPAASRNSSCEHYQSELEHPGIASIKKLSRFETKPHS